MRDSDNFHPIPTAIVDAEKAKKRIGTSPIRFLYFNI